MGSCRTHLRATATRQIGGMMESEQRQGSAADGGPLGVRLRAAREARGLTQAQAAAELQVSRPLLIAMEKGSREVQPDELIRLARLYDRPVSELLRPTAPPVAIGARFRAALASVPEADNLPRLIVRLEELADNDAAESVPARNRSRPFSMVSHWTCTLNRSPNPIPIHPLTLQQLVC